MLLRVFAADLLGLAYAVSLSRLCPVRLAPLGFGSPPVGGELLLTPVTDDYINVVAVPLGTMYGVDAPASAYLPDAADVALGGRVDGARTAATMAAEMGLGAPAADLGTKAKIAFEALWTAGHVNVALVLPANLGVGRAPPPEARETETEALMRYDLIAPHNEHLYSAISAIASVWDEPLDRALLAPLDMFLAQGEHVAAGFLLEQLAALGRP